MADNMVKVKNFLPGEVVDLREEIALISPTDTPLTTLLLGMGKVVPANDITVTWREKQLNEDRGTLKLEGSEAGTPIISSRKSLSNICQIIEKVTQVSGTAQKLNPKGIGDVFNAEVQDRLKEVKRDLEFYYLSGTKALGDDSTPRQMNGLINLVNENNVVDAKNADITEAMLLDALQKMWDAGSQGEYYCFVGAAIKRAINELVQNSKNVRVDIANATENTYGVTVSRYESDFGTLRFILDRYAPKDVLFGVDLEQVEIAELRGTFYKDLPASGDYLKGHVLNESTIKLLNSYAGAKIINAGKKE